MTRPRIGALALGSIAAVFTLHWQVIWLGLQPDSLLMTRPWSLTQLRAALTGTWLFPNVDYYHRPLTTILFAADFTAFGLNSRALHLESLVMLAAVTWMLGCWLWREAGPGAAISAMALYLTHPVLLDSSIAGEQYHFHLVPLMLVVATLWTWARRRSSVALRHWWPLFLLPVIGFYFKEDTIMVLPAMLVLQAVRARAVRDVPAPSIALVGTTAIVAVMLAAIRWWVFPHFETADGLWSRIGFEALKIAAYAPARTAFGMFANAELLIGTTSFVLLLQAAGAWRAWREPGSRAGWAWICGLVLLVSFCLPIAITAEIRATRVHLAVLSAALMLGAGAMALVEWALVPARWWRPAAVLTVIVGITAQATVQRQTRIDRFEPCSEIQLSANEYAETWPEIPPDLRQWLHDMPQVCASGQFATPEDHLPSIRWSDSNRHVVLVRRDAARATLTFDRPARDLDVLVTIDGARRAMTLSAAAPELSLSLTPTWRTWLRRDYRIDIHDMHGAALPMLSSVRVE